MKQMADLIRTLFIPLLFVSYQSHAQPVPRDPELHYGKLPNGITYYVRQNNKPEERASFFIIQKVGALVEDKDQNGLAHFLEHMAFNGTTNFPGSTLIDYLESKGVTFGQKINAYTNFTETVYNLSDIQVDDPGLIDSCLLILHDWSHEISLNKDDFANERGVIAEEYRTRKSGNQRVYFETLRSLLKGSKYEERDIIGDMDVILNAPVERIQDLYHDWYRTDLQAIVVVGDIDPLEIEKKIKDLFTPIPAVENPEPMPFFSVPFHKGTNYDVITDNEITRSSITSYTLFEVGPAYSEDRSVLHQSTLIALFNSMIRSRITELLQKSDVPPFISGSIAYGSYVKGYEIFYVSASSDAVNEKTAFEKIMAEVEKISRYGFTDSELTLAKQELLTNLEQEYKSEKYNEEFVEDYQDHFLLNLPIPSKKYMYEESVKIVNDITAEMIRAKIAEWTTADNRTIIVTGSVADSGKHMTSGEAFAILDKVKQSEIEEYKDEDISRPLISEDLKGGRIVKEKKLPDFDAVEWTLSNKARVVYKHSDLEKNDVTFLAFSSGGTSRYGSDMLESAGLVTYLVPWFGLGEFDAIALQKKLKGEDASVSPVLSSNECSEGFRGTSSPQDFETLLQLLYLYFEKPRFDKKAFDNIIKRNMEAAVNRYNDPSNVKSDSTARILTDYNERIKLLGTVDYFKAVDFNEVEKIYRDRFRDAGDFIFFIVGNISRDSAASLVEKYIGSITDDPRAEKCADNNVRWPKGKTLRRIPVEMDEPKTTIIINYNRVEKYASYDKLVMDAVGRILRIKYTETIREKEGGSYGVYSNYSIKHYPVAQGSFVISFDCKPENAEKLTELIYEEINKIRQNGPSKEDLKKVVLAMQNEREEALKLNSFWAGILYSYYYDGVNNISPKNFDKILEKLDSEKVQKKAAGYFDKADVVEIRYVPMEK